MADPTPASGGELGELIRQLQDIKRRLAEVESPSGTQRYQSVEKLSALIDDIQAQLDAYNASRYTNAQIDARIANPPGGVAAAGNVSAGGDVSAGAGLRGQNLYAAQAPGFNITGTRVAAWLETATGRLGTASSSRRYKQDEAPAGLDPLVVLSIEPKRFRYKDQVEELGDEAAIEVGFIAEDLDDAGLTPWVVYREIDEEIVADGVEYSTLSVAQQVVLRYLHERDQQQSEQLATQQQQIDALTARLDATDGGPHGAD
jgi:hypothetical protein